MAKVILSLKVLSFSMKFLSDLQEIFTSVFLAFGFCFSHESISQKSAIFWQKFKKMLFKTLLGGKNSYKILSRFEILVSYGRINIGTRKKFCSSYCLILIICLLLSVTKKAKRLEFVVSLYVVLIYQNIVFHWCI